MHILVHEKEEREKGVEIFKELMADNFLNQERDLDIQVYETQQSPKRFNLKIFSPKTIMLKISKIEEKILKAIIEKKILTYQGAQLGYQHISQKKSHRLERVEYKIQRLEERKKKKKKTSVSEVYFTWQAVLRNIGDKDFPRQIKAEDVHHL